MVLHGQVLRAIEYFGAYLSAVSVGVGFQGGGNCRRLETGAVDDQPRTAAQRVEAFNMGLFCAGGTTSTLSLVSGLSGAVAGCAKAAVLRVPRRLVPGTPLWEMVVDNLRVGLSPDQIAGTLKLMALALDPVNSRMWPSIRPSTPCHAASCAPR